MPGRGSNVSRWLPIMALVVVVMVGAVVVGALLSRALITEQPQETATVAPQTPTAETPIAMSDLPEVEIRAPSDNAEVVLGGEVGVYVRAVDRIGVTRIEMRVNNQPIDSAGSPDPNGALVLDSILSWTPTTPGRNVIQVVAYRGGIVGNPKTITVTVRDNAALPTQTPPPPGVTPLPPTFTATADPTCRVRINSSGINVRRGPGLNYEVITSLAFAAVVPVTGISPDGAWYQVNAVGFIGWVSTQFVTPLGFCGGIGVIAPPPSPIPAGGTQVVILPTWTPFPTLPLPTATSTIPVVVLPTLTATIYIPPQPGQVSVGDLTSTAIYATQTKLAQIPSPLPTNTPTVTPLPGETVAPTATPSDTPTVTPTPLLPDVIVSAIDLASTTVILDATTRQATLPVKVTVKNNGQALAPTFDVALRLFDGTAITKRTTVVLDLGAETTLDFDVTFKTEGVQTLTVIADSTNGVPESDKTNNVATREVTVIVATVTNPTATATPTDTATPDVTATPIPPTETPVPPTETLIPPPDTATPEPETATPEAPTTTPEPETATPEAPTTTPEPETATPEAPTTTPEPETATPEAPTTTPEPPTETPIPATAMPSISVQPSCTAELVASFVLINNGGAMSAPTAFTITNINGAVVLAGGDLLMEAGGSRVLTVQGVSGVLTLSIPQYQVFAQADCPVPTATAEPPTVTPEPATETPIPATPMPAISVQPSCTAELVASFVLINNGGAMSFPTSYTVVDSSGIPLLGGSDLQLEAGGNRVLTVQGIPGVITLNVPEYQLVSQANCPLPTATPEQATATPEPSVDIVDLGAVAVQPSLNNQTQQIMRGIHALWLQSGGTGNDFSLTGNGLLLGISDLYSQSANFDQYAGLAQSILDNYGAAVQALQGRYGQCNAGTPIQCPQGRSPLVFIDTVSVAMQTGTPVDTYRNDLTALVGQLAQQGMIPVLVTTPGRADDQALATYNTAVFRVAEANQLPLFNLYGIGAVNPALLDPFGKLTDPGAGARADFSAGVLATFGVNNAVLELMTLLEEVRTTIFTP